MRSTHGHTLIVEMTVAYQTSALVLEAEAKARSLYLDVLDTDSSASSKIFNAFFRVFQIATDGKE